MLIQRSALLLTTVSVAVFCGCASATGRSEVPVVLRANTVYEVEVQNPTPCAAEVRVSSSHGQDSRVVAVVAAGATERVSVMSHVDGGRISAIALKPDRTLCESLRNQTVSVRVLGEA